MRDFPVTFIAALSLLAASCSDKPETDNQKAVEPTVAEEKSAGDSGKETEESESALEPVEIGEDCVAFLRATKTVPTDGEEKGCPECPGGSAHPETLKFNTFKIEKITPSESTCEALVEIRAEFNPGPGGKIVGGLVGWISPEQREQYSQGKVPPGQQLYKVKITYHRTGGVWRAAEFDRVD